MLDRIFNWNKKPRPPRPDIPVGRYTDNNKSVVKSNLWTESENLFKEKKYFESIDVFFKYLKDDRMNNVSFDRNEHNFKFDIFQGSKIVRGTGNKEFLHAHVILAKMAEPSVPVMRRLLEQNFTLYYSRYSLDHERLLMQFDTEIDSANPNKLYYALKELATTADKQDDLLVHDFKALEKLDADHIEDIPAEEKKIKYNFLQNSISETLEQVSKLDPEKYTGGVAYLLLALIYRLDYLLVPQGALMNDLEKIQAIYFKKDNLSNIEKNRLMMLAIEKLKQKPEEEIANDLFRTTSSFSVRLPKSFTGIAEAITNANKSMIWYRDNNYPEVARQICEYGLSFCQYSYSLARPLTEYFQILMEVNYTGYFKSLGFPETYYNAAKQKFDRSAIQDETDRITLYWKEKYPNLNFNNSSLKFDNLVNFNHSFTAAVAELNLESN